MANNNDYSVGGIKLNLPDLVTELQKILTVKNEISQVCTDNGATSMSSKAFSEYPGIISQLIGTGGGGVAQMQLYAPNVSIYSGSNNISYTDVNSNTYNISTYYSLYYNTCVLSNFYINISNPSNNGSFANKFIITANSWDSISNTSTPVCSYSTGASINNTINGIQIYDIFVKSLGSNFKAAIDSNNNNYKVSAKIAGKNMITSTNTYGNQVIYCTEIQYNTSNCNVKLNTINVVTSSTTNVLPCVYFYVTTQHGLVSYITPFNDNVAINKYWLPRSIKLTITDCDGNEFIDYVENYCTMPYKNLTYVITNTNYRYINFECVCETYPQLNIPKIDVDSINNITCEFPYASQAIEFYDADTDECIGSITTDAYEAGTNIVTADYTGSTYVFARNGNTFTSTNHVHDTYSAVKLTYINTNSKPFILTLQNITQSSEYTYDYGIIGKINTVISSNNPSSSDVLKSFKGSNIANETYNLTFPANTTSFYYIIYRKDGSVNNGTDTFSFTINYLCNDNNYIHKLLSCDNTEFNVFKDSEITLVNANHEQNITMTYKIFDEYDNLIYSIEEEGV